MPNIELIHSAGQHFDPCHSVKSIEAAQANEKVVPINGNHSNQILLDTHLKSGH